MRRGKRKRALHKSKMVTGYIIYASEIRKDVIKKFPDRDFGDISKLVGIEWKNLPQETKDSFEQRARKQNAVSKERAAESLQKSLQLQSLQQSYNQQFNEQQQIQQQQPNFKPTFELKKLAVTQTEPIEWIYTRPKKPLRYSQKFIEYLKLNANPNETQQTNNINQTNGLIGDKNDIFCMIDDGNLKISSSKTETSALIE